MCASFSALPPELVLAHVVPYLGSAHIAVLAKVNRTIRAHLWRVRLLYLWPRLLNKYLLDPAFRSEFASFLPVDRLCLSIEAPTTGAVETPLTDLSPFAGAHTANLWNPGLPGPSIGTADLSYLNGVHTVALRLDMQVTPDIDLRSLARAHSLTLSVSGDVDLHPVADVPCLNISCSSRSATLSSLRGCRRPLPVHVTLQTVGREHPSADILSPLACAGAETVRSVAFPACSVGVIALAHCTALRRLHRADGLVDFSALSHLHTAVLGHHDAIALPDALGRVHTLVLNGWKRLRDVSAAHHVHTLVAAASPLCNLQPLSRVHTLHCSLADGTDISPLRSALTLHLTVSEGGEVHGMAALGRVHTLHFAGDVVDRAEYLALSHVCDLTLHRVHDIVKVSHLRDVHRLSLIGCDGVADVAALGRMYSLKVNFCRRLSDVSALGHVHTLDLGHCESVVDVSALGHVHTLNLARCSRVRDASRLGGVYNLNLSSTSVCDVSALGHVRILTLTNCLVTDVCALGSVHQLNVSFCKKLTDCSALGRVHTLSLAGSPVVDVSCLGGVHTLNISCCPVVDVRALGGVRVLTVEGCRDIDDFSALANVPKLHPPWVLERGSALVSSLLLD